MHEIIRIHNYLPPKITHNKYAITRIIFEKYTGNIILSLDTNNKDIRHLDYKDIKLCQTHNIEFKNQSVGGLLQELRTVFFDKNHTINSPRNTEKSYI